MENKTADRCRADLGLILIINYAKFPTWVHADFLVSPFSTSASRETAFKEILPYLSGKDAGECRQLLDQLKELEEKENKK